MSYQRREPDQELMQQIRKLAYQKRLSSEILEAKIREAMETGHSYRQVATAAGVSVNVVQRIMKKCA